MLAASLLLGALVLAGVLGVYAWAVAAGRTPGETRAVAFAAIVCGNLGLILALRSRSLLDPNPALWIIVAGTLAALAAAIYAPAVAPLFGFEALTATDVVRAAAAGTAGVVLYAVWRLVAGARA
jgi:Ca2+-transporting ATPase